MQIPRPPLLPPNSNNSTIKSDITQTSTLQVQDRLSFFNVDPVSQQIITGATVSSVILLLQRYGMIAPGYFQEVGPLLGDGTTGNASQASVALSSDGNTLAIGGPHDNTSGQDSIGATWVFTKINGIWVQQGPKLVGTGYTGTNIQQGSSVSLSSDGNTLAVGGIYDNGTSTTGIGATWIFTRTNDTWTQEGSKLVGTGYVGTNSLQGWSVSLSSDGNTLAVGGPCDNGTDTVGIGATWMFTRTSGTWTQEGPKLVGSEYNGIDVEQGICVSLSLDGNTVAIGGPYDNNADGISIGATWVFTRTGGTWTQQGSKLVGSGYSGSPYQGYAISMKINTLIIGGYNDEQLPYGTLGATWVFTRSNGIWTQQGPKLVGTGYITPDVEQGGAVSITDDETMFITAGGADNNQIGAVWVFKNINGVWTQYNNKLVGSGYYYATPPKFGYNNSQACISGDGTTIAFGSLDNNPGGDPVVVGGVWVFVGF